jgi:hypothetical protein
MRKKREKKVKLSSCLFLAAPYHQNCLGMPVCLCILFFLYDKRVLAASVTYV